MALMISDLNDEEKVNSWPSVFSAWFPLNMAVGKNNNKMGKKGGKKKAVDPFARKEWFDIKAPSMFYNRQVGKTLINRTQGTKIASEGLKGRVFEVSLADLNDSEADFRKFKLVCEDVQGKNVLTNFHAMSMTRDKLCSIVKKWHTLIEANGVFKTTDGYVLHLFCIGFTKRSPNQVKKTTYTKASKVRKIRARMLELMKRESIKERHEQNMHIKSFSGRHFLKNHLFTSHFENFTN
ncbi:unnamed protein product [Strongylus vulgaris]|uniref:Small ribosomal subunit protein eS1 n=1 Tax=Strongylus vulgaris TaxID=40348 RepID=A0A3P7J1G4_STRVU|nr:unnamed protein product [Strongylus vulgaris]